MPRAAKRHSEYKRRTKVKDRFYDSPLWRRFRVNYLAMHPLCVMCNEAASHVDHIEARSIAPEREYDESNLQALCQPCHSRKTVKDDGGFGRGSGGVNL